MSASVYCVLDSVASMHLYTSYLYNSSWELKLTVWFYGQGVRAI